MNHDERADFSKFGKSFQENLCQLILQDRIFSEQIHEVLNYNFLELKYLRVFVEKVYNYKKKYGMHPSTDVMTTILRSELSSENELIQKQVRDFYARMCSTEVQDAEYIKDTALDFCKKQTLKEAILKSVNLLQNSSFDEIQKLINDAMKLGVNNDYGYDYIKDFEERFKFKVRSPITTGWKIVDDLCKGGLGVGELGVVISPTGAGKSMVLVHLGASAVKSGKTVVHYTLELSDKVIATRYDSCITGIHLKELHTYKDLIHETVKNIKGQLIIKEYPTKSITTNMIKTHLEKLKQRDIIPDMIIVDYADLLRPTVVRKEKRTELESIYEELRCIAHENTCPCWTASQTNRSGLNAEVITMESISEAFNKCFVADFIFSISRTIKHKSANTGRLFVAKNRNGIDGVVYPIFMDPSNVKIDILPMEHESVSEIIEASMKEQSISLKEKYKTFRNKGK